MLGGRHLPLQHATDRVGGARPLRIAPAPAHGHKLQPVLQHRVSLLYFAAMFSAKSLQWTATLVLAAASLASWAIFALWLLEAI